MLRPGTPPPLKKLDRGPTNPEAPTGMNPIDQDTVCDNYDQLLQLADSTRDYIYEFYIHPETKAIAVRIDCIVPTQTPNGYYLFAASLTLSSALAELGVAPAQRRIRVEHVLADDAFHTEGTPWHNAENFIDTPMKDLPLSQAEFDWA